MDGMVTSELLNNIDVSIKANVYWNGKVTSRTFYRQDGSRFTLGIITAGSYTFDVEDREVVRLIVGEAEVRLPAETEWKWIKAGETFEVIRNSQYDIRTNGVVEYVCDYFPE